MNKPNPQGMEKLVDEIIEKCEWRKDFCGVDICQGNCLPCKRVVENGQCPSLIEIFGKEEVSK